MKSTNPKASSSETVLARLKKRAARGSVERNIIAVRLSRLKDQGKINQEQYDHVLGIQKKEAE